MQVKANAVASAADIVFFFFINYIFGLSLFGVGEWVGGVVVLVG